MNLIELSLQESMKIQFKYLKDTTYKLAFLISFPKIIMYISCNVVTGKQLENEKNMT